MPKNPAPTIFVNYTISEIAYVIKKNWKPVYFGAVPYLYALECIDSINDDYCADSGKSIVAYFLCNASSWRGTTAKEVKLELNRRLKSK